MEKVINTYETLFIVDPTIGDDAVKAVVEKFTALIADNGTISEINEWGKRRLAYPINDINEGHYVVVTYKSEPEFPAELERLFKINDAIMRTMTLKLDEKVMAKVAAAAAAREAAAAAAAEAAETTDQPEA